MKTIKGQGAMEYLMTYGWAILVIVIVVAALYSLGVLNPATYQQKRCSGFQYFSYTDQKLSTSEFTLDVRNGVNDISIDSIKVGSAATNSTPVISDADIQEGDRFTISTTTVPSVTSGATYDNIEIVVQYDVTNGIQNNVDRATCIGRVA